MAPLHLGVQSEAGWGSQMCKVVVLQDGPDARRCPAGRGLAAPHVWLFPYIQVTSEVWHCIVKVFSKLKSQRLGDALSHWPCGENMLARQVADGEHQDSTLLLTSRFYLPALPSRLASDSWTCPCSASCTASTSPSRIQGSLPGSCSQPRQHLRSGERLFKEDEGVFPGSRPLQDGKERGPPRDLTPARLPTPPAATGSWTPCKGCRRQATVSMGFSSVGRPLEPVGPALPAHLQAEMPGLQCGLFGVATFC